MSQVFSQKPWVMPEEPPRIKKIFEQHGKVLQYKKGAIFSHGSDNSSVYLVIKGLVTFGYFDSLDHYQVLSLILPGRSIGDLDSLDSQPCNVLAECLRPTTVLAVPHGTWISELHASVANMEAYANSANLKHQCAMEGMIANYTQPLEHRLRLLLFSLISSYYNIRKDSWNPCPITITITDIAKVVACNRCWVSRTISRWSRENLIKKDGRLLLISSSLFTGLSMEEISDSPLSKFLSPMYR